MDQQENREKHRNLQQRLFYMVPFLAVVAMLVFGGLYLRDYFQYKGAADEYAELSDAYIRAEAAADASGEKTEAAIGETTEALSPEDPRYVPALSIDYDALQKTNPDFACVLYIPVLDLKYPVVYSEDNNDYLHRTFEGKNNFAGSIFYDCLSPHDFRGRNTFLFGHNMKNGSMFGTLKKFEKEAGLCASDPYIYIYTKDYIRKYRIFSYYETSASGRTYEDFDGNDGYDQYVKMACANSALATSEHSIDFTKRPQLLTLSTCVGRSGSDQRFVVHAALVYSAAAE